MTLGLAVGLYTFAAYLSASSRADAEADRLAREWVDATVAITRTFVAEVEAEADFSARLIEAGVVETVGTGTIERLFFEQLLRREQVRALYIGRSDGSFEMVRRVVGDDRTWFETRRIDPDASERRVRIERWSDQFVPLGAAVQVRDGFDPRLRPWYRAVAAADDGVWSQPYLYWSSDDVGVTYARPLLCSETGVRCVLGIDISVGALEQFLSVTTKVDRIGAFINQPNGRLIASSPHTAPGSLTAALEASRTGARVFTGEIASYVLAVADLGANGVPWTVGVFAPRLTFASWSQDIGRIELAAIGVALLMAIGAATVLWAAIAHDLRRLLGFAGVMGRSSQAGQPPRFGFIEMEAVAYAMSDIDRSITQQIQVLERALFDAVQSDQSKSEFLAQMSHELRTPLNAVIGFAELLRHTASDRLTEREMGYLLDIATAGRHQLALVGDVLDYAQAQSGHLELKQETVLASTVLDEALALVIGHAEGKELDISIHRDVEMLLSIDRVKIRRILVNLLQNSIKYTNRGGKVDVSVALCPDGRPSFRIADTGIGMSAAELAVVRQPFVRAAPSDIAVREGGIGLGLAIVQVLVHLHNGTFDLFSTPGIGTVAEVRLPIATVVNASRLG